MLHLYVAEFPKLNSPKVDTVFWEKLINPQKQQNPPGLNFYVDCM